MTTLAEGPRSRGRPRSEPSKRAVLAAAVELLGEVSFDSLSMGAIAARAGVSKATLYRWWDNKVDVVVDAVDALAVEALTEPDTGSLDGDIRSVLGDLLVAMRSTLGKVAEALAAASRHNPALYQALDQHFLAYRHGMVVRMLRRAAERGEVRDGVDNDLVADAVVALFFYRIRRQPSSLDSALVEGFIELLTDGLRRQP